MTSQFLHLKKYLFTIRIRKRDLTQANEPPSVYTVELLVIFHQYHAWTNLAKSVTLDLTFRKAITNFGDFETILALFKLD